MGIHLSVHTRHEGKSGDRRLANMNDRVWWPGYAGLAMKRSDRNTSVQRIQATLVFLSLHFIAGRQRRPPGPVILMVPHGPPWESVSRYCRVTLT